MDQILSSIRVLTPLVIVAITATLAQRKWGSKALLWLWIASAVVITGATLSWIFYKHGLPSAQELFQHLFTFAFLVTYLFAGITFASGGVIWCVAVLGPRPPQDSSPEVNYFLLNMPAGKFEDPYGLEGILARHHQLLESCMRSLDTALASSPFNPYLFPPSAFLKSFRMYIPRFMRQARASSRRFIRVPDALMMDLAGAHVVLAELETLTAAHLSAIEECHRVNVRRLRQRTILGWPWGKITAVCAVCAAVITSVVAAAEKVAGVKPSDLWPHIRDIPLTGAGLQSSMTQGVTFTLVMVLVFFVMNIMTYLPILRRVQAFEDILAIAKAYCKGDSGASKPQRSQGREP
jgi:hypothetical protein